MITHDKLLLARIHVLIRYYRHNQLATSAQRRATPSLCLTREFADRKDFFPPEARHLGSASPPETPSWAG